MQHPNAPPSLNQQLYRITWPSAATGTMITLIFLPMSSAVHVCVSLCIESGISSHSSLMFSFTISGSCLPVSGHAIQNFTVRICFVDILLNVCRVERRRKTARNM